MPIDIKQKLKNLPSHPGVYIYYDKEGSVLYVGKAKNLKNRIRQYFASSQRQEKVLAMLSHMENFDYILTPTEGDAFSLENTLIKKYLPPYNILLKDDKQHSYIKINIKADFPKLEVVRKLSGDNARYFGPLSAGARDTMDMIAAVYPTLTCNINFNKLPKNFRPCLNYHIGRCPAPCTGAISKEDYKKIIQKVISLLSGNDKEAREILTEKMLRASEEMKYELALQYKRYLEVLERTGAGRITELPKHIDMEIFSICSNGNNAIVNVMAVRAGKIVMSENHSALDAGIDESQTLASFLSAYCDGENIISSEILINVPLEEDMIEDVISKRYGRKITVKQPLRGIKKKLSDMGYQNAKEALEKNQSYTDRRYNTTIGACNQLKELLELDNVPKRIECYDISNISGVDKVASMVVFTNGQKDSKAYRRFKIRTVEGANDFASMEEVLRRRMQRLMDNDEQFGARPDLIVVDGGLGQLEYARRALSDFSSQIILPQLVSLAKREELVYTLNGKESIRLPRDSYALNLLINIRDEAHRFAITYFRNLHTRSALKSALSDIEGVGSKRQLLLIKHFKNIDAISKATVEEIVAAGIPTKTAQAISDYFNK